MVLHFNGISQQEKLKILEVSEWLTGTANFSVLKFPQFRMLHILPEGLLTSL